MKARASGAVAATETDGQRPPLLDAAVLDRLRAELDGDQGVWSVFIQDFITQLPERIERLRQALTGGDRESAMDAVLSLRTSSQMVGAQRLAALALQLERSLREAADSDPAVALPQLAAALSMAISFCPWAAS